MQVSFFFALTSLSMGLHCNVEITIRCEKNSGPNSEASFKNGSFDQLLILEC